MQPMRPTYRLKACDVLYNEHRTVNAKLTELQPQLGPAVAAAAFAKGLLSLIRALEKELPPHFAKEEEGLFPVLETVTGQGFPPVEVMKAEHRYLIETFGTLRGASAKLTVSPEAREARADALKGVVPLVDTLEQHIVKEDSILLVMASEQIEPSHDSRILRVYDEIDREGRRWA
jgi:iron-sulfur cluster repair protein YtfE (RIC family)